MASLTIRQLDDGLKAKLRLRAARHNRSMEEEARDMLRLLLAEDAEPPANLALAIRRRVEGLGGIDLEPLPRPPMREPPRFDDEADRDA